MCQKVDISIIVILNIFSFFKQKPARLTLSDEKSLSDKHMYNRYDLSLMWYEDDLADFLLDSYEIDIDRES